MYAVSPHSSLKWMCMWQQGFTVQPAHAQRNCRFTGSQDYCWGAIHLKPALRSNGTANCENQTNQSRTCQTQSVAWNPLTAATTISNRAAPLQPDPAQTSLPHTNDLAYSMATSLLQPSSVANQVCHATALKKVSCRTVGWSSLENLRISIQPLTALTQNGT